MDAGDDLVGDRSRPARHILGPDVGEELFSARHPEGRIAFFVGDLTDRGPHGMGQRYIVALIYPAEYEEEMARWLLERQ